MAILHYTAQVQGVPGFDSPSGLSKFYLKSVRRFAGSVSRAPRRAPATKTNAKMSIVPMMFRDWWDRWEDWDRPSRLLDQHFGVGLRREDLLSSLSALPTSSLLRNSYFRPWRTNLARQESSSTINMTKDKFEMMRSRMRSRMSSLRRCAETFRSEKDEILPYWVEKVILDVQQFKPEEITVKAAQNSVTVEGKHEERPDEHGYISRQFVRRYVLPSGYNVEDLVSTLSSDGVLTISAPKRPPPQAGERVVPLTRVGPVRQDEPKQEPKQEPPVPPRQEHQQQQQQPRETNIYVQKEQPREHDIPIQHEQTVPIVTSP